MGSGYAPPWALDPKPLYIYEYINLHLHLHLHLYLYLYLYIYIYIHIRMYIYIYIYLYLYLDIDMEIHAYVYMYVCIDAGCQGRESAVLTRENTMKVLWRQNGRLLGQLRAALGVQGRQRDRTRTPEQRLL